MLFVDKRSPGTVTARPGVRSLNYQHNNVCPPPRNVNDGFGADLALSAANVHWRALRVWQLWGHLRSSSGASRKHLFEHLESTSRGAQKVLKFVLKSVLELLLLNGSRAVI